MNTLINALGRVLGRPSYLLLAVIVSLATFSLSMWLPNLSLIIAVFNSGVALSDKIEFLFVLLGSIVTDFSFSYVLYDVLIYILFGISIAMITYYLRRRIDEVRHSGITTGFLGLLSGVLGLGCAACGSFLLAAILPFIGASGVLRFLPLHGSEFGIIGVLFLMTSIYLLSKQIQNPAVCRI